MIKITELAWQRLAEMQSTRTDVTALRLKLKNGSVKCHRGVRRPTDLVLHAPSRPTLLMSEALAEHLASSTLDARATDRGLRLHLEFRDAKPQSIANTRKT